MKRNIEPTELRIGNYIYDDFDEVHIVEKIESKKFNDWNGSEPSLVVFSKIKDEYNGMYTCDVVSGIPLTEEWLLKFGAKELKPRRGILKEFVLKTVRLELSNGHNIYYKNSKVIIDSVHQLQNLFFSLKQTELKYEA